MKFVEFANAVRGQFNSMSVGQLYTVGIDPELLWNHYLNSFPEGTNKVFRERREYDCAACRQFIRQAGNVVAIIDGKVVSIWDINLGDEVYQVVADKMSEAVKDQPITNKFVHFQKTVGTFNNTEVTNNGEITWHHFAAQIPKRFVKKQDDIGTYLSRRRANFDTLYRSLNEITLESAEIVLELIEQNSLYRGEEFKAMVEGFVKAKKDFDEADDKKLFCWQINKGGVRNKVIGSLLVDISEGVELDNAVRMFEAKVAPQNYKRPTAVVTKRMIDAAQKALEDAGFGESIYRRCAVAEDISINDVLFADRDTKTVMAGSVFDELKSELPDKVKNLDKVEEVSIDDFLKNIVPKANSLELMFENKQENNLMTLTAPTNDVSNILKWGNNFCWSYKGEVADSIKKNVEKFGGDVNGVLRFSIQWNEKGDNPNDYDAHCRQPSGCRGSRLISYPLKGSRQSTSGMLDVDIIDPRGKVAVENITYNDLDKMPEGDYKFLNHCFTHKGGRSGFAAEIEFDGNIYSFEYRKDVPQNAKIEVATVNYSKKDGFKITKSLPSSLSSKEVYSIATQKFHRVKMLMKSPNHWEGENTGNKHYFFILEGCKTDEPIRGLYNEFLNESLKDHRKTFEMLGSRLKAEPVDNQLSGLGFSSTRKDSVLCRVKGNFNRIIKIKF